MGVVAGVATSSEITETSKRMQALKENLLRLIQSEKESLLAGQSAGQEETKGPSAEAAPAQGRVAAGSPVAQAIPAL